MLPNALIENAEVYLRKLCLDFPSRRTGSLGNRAATDFFERCLVSFDLETEKAWFDCLDWIQSGADLRIDRASFTIFPSPYSLACRAVAPLMVVSTIDELAAVQHSGDILLLRGELAREPLMPKNFPFYNPEEHQRIYSFLEAQNPAAILTASSRNPEMAGGIYPWSMIEDGDFDIPSAYMTEEEGERLTHFAGQTVLVDIQAKRIPATGCNVIARKGERQDQRVVFCAHIDTKEGTPGALDNASGITTLLLLGELLREYSGQLCIEIVALNGEDYYSNPGEQLYLRSNEGRFGEILLAVNLDGVGFSQGQSAFSLYECPLGLVSEIQATFSTYQGMRLGEPWYQGDHSLFLMNGRPAIAITSEKIFELMETVIHTLADMPELIDPARLVEVAEALKALVIRLDQLSQ